MDYKHIAHIAFNVTDAEKTLDFYCKGLGMREAYTLNFDVVLETFKKDIAEGTIPAGMGKEQLEYFEKMKDKPWHTYLQVAKGQFIEIFYTYNNEQLVGDVTNKCGYQHCCLLVDNIEAARKEIIANGIVPMTEIQLGPDYSKQFWVEDPDGNRIELMEYTKQSWQSQKAVIKDE